MIVETLHHPTKAELQRAVAANRPIVITGVIDDWEAMEWGGAFFENELGSIETKYRLHQKVLVHLCRWGLRLLT